MSKTLLILMAMTPALLSACGPKGQPAGEAVAASPGNVATVVPAATNQPVTLGSGDQGTPPRGARNVFQAFSTGVNGVHVLKDMDTGCEWLATPGPGGSISIVRRSDTACAR